MTIFANLLSRATSLDVNDPVTALDKAVHRDFDEIIANGDAAAPHADLAEKDEVQTLSASGATGGTFDITLNFRVGSGVGSLVSVAVTGIAYNANAATIESAIDSAVTSAGTVTGWTNGDISVSSAGTAEAEDVVFTFDGDSVSGRRQPLATVDGGSLTGGGSEAFAVTTAGQHVREVWSILYAWSLVDFGGTTPPVQITGSIPTLTASIDRSRARFTDATLRFLAREAEIQDEIVGLEAALLDAMNLNPNPPASSQG